MKESLKLVQCLFNDCALMCSTTGSRDLATIEARLSHEGLSFLTITLPNFLKDFMNCLEEGQVTSDHFIGWKKRLCLPAFMQGFTSLVFDPQSGRIYDYEKVNVYAIRAVRQICSFFKKVKIPCTRAREINAFDSYTAMDDDMAGLLETIPTLELEKFLDVTAIIWSTVFNEGIDVESLIPHHGPGSTAEKCLGNKKFVPSYSWPKRLASVFPPEYFALNSEETYHACQFEPKPLELDEELPVRVVSVPKTLLKPRIIALEPVSMQFCQQAVKDYVVDRIESHWLTRGHINFSDQSLNRKLALESSETQRLATLDLSAASDRVHKELVYMMLSANPQLRDLVFKTRSRTASVSGKRINLNKFASMGSALCFPIEAMMFFSIIVLARLERRHLPVTLHNVNLVKDDCFVYGDDILVPSEDVESVIRLLHCFGNKVGLDKSFVKGLFRESCGMDAYGGVDITPIYVRNPLPNRQSDVSSIVSSVATANLLYKRGYLQAAFNIKDIVERQVGTLPTVADTCSGLGWEFQTDQNYRSRWNSKLQRLEVRSLVPKLEVRKDRLWGYCALNKCLSNLERREGSYESEAVTVVRGASAHETWKRNRDEFEQISSSDKDHLKRSPRFGTLTLKRRWVALY